MGLKFYTYTCGFFAVFWFCVFLGFLYEQTTKVIFPREGIRAFPTGFPFIGEVSTIVGIAWILILLSFSASLARKAYQGFRKNLKKLRTHNSTQEEPFE